MIYHDLPVYLYGSVFPHFQEVLRVECASHGRADKFGELRREMQRGHHEQADHLFLAGISARTAYLQSSRTAYCSHTKNHSHAANSGAAVGRPDP